MSTFTGLSNRQGSTRVYEQEVSLNHIFDDLSEGFKKLDEMNDSKKQSELKRMTGLMQEAKSYVDCCCCCCASLVFWTAFWTVFCRCLDRIINTIHLMPLNYTVNDTV